MSCPISELVLKGPETIMFVQPAQLGLVPVSTWQKKGKSAGRKMSRTSVTIEANHKSQRQRRQAARFRQRALLLGEGDGSGHRAPGEAHRAGACGPRSLALRRLIQDL